MEVETLDGRPLSRLPYTSCNHEVNHPGSLSSTANHGGGARGATPEGSSAPLGALGALLGVLFLALLTSGVLLRWARRARGDHVLVRADDTCDGDDAADGSVEVKRKC